MLVLHIFSKAWWTNLRVSVYLWGLHDHLCPDTQYVQGSELIKRPFLDRSTALAFPLSPHCTRSGHCCCRCFFCLLDRQDGPGVYRMRRAAINVYLCVCESTKGGRGFVEKGPLDLWKQSPDSWEGKYMWGMFVLHLPPERSCVHCPFPRTADTADSPWARHIFSSPNPKKGWDLNLDLLNILLTCIPEPGVKAGCNLGSFADSP